MRGRVSGILLKYNHGALVVLAGGLVLGGRTAPAEIMMADDK